LRGDIHGWAHPARWRKPAAEQEMAQNLVQSSRNSGRRTGRCGDMAALN
jgi:hypothetical protein